MIPKQVIPRERQKEQNNNITEWKKQIGFSSWGRVVGCILVNGTNDLKKNGPNQKTTWRFP